MFQFSFAHAMNWSSSCNRFLLKLSNLSKRRSSHIRRPSSILLALLILPVTTLTPRPQPIDRSKSRRSVGLNETPLSLRESVKQIRRIRWSSFDLFDSNFQRLLLGMKHSSWRSIWFQAWLTASNDRVTAYLEFPLNILDTLEWLTREEEPTLRALRRVNCRVNCLTGDSTSQGSVFAISWIPCRWRCFWIVLSVSLLWRITWMLFHGAYLLGLVIIQWGSQIKFIHMAHWIWILICHLVALVVVSPMGLLQICVGVYSDWRHPHRCLGSMENGLPCDLLTRTDWHYFKLRI